MVPGLIALFGMVAELTKGLSALNDLAATAARRGEDVTPDEIKNALVAKGVWRDEWHALLPKSED